MIFSHHRFEIWNQNQHPYRHDLSEFAYTNNSLPGVSSVAGALDYLMAVIYPNTKASVANPAALPAVGNTINDYRVVLDDGDGKAAGYRWVQYEGESSASWHKIYDVDFGAGTYLAQAFENYQDLFAQKFGNDDLDATGVAITGTLAGQTIFGGKSANTNLTLKANAGDGTGAQTGYIQFGDHFRPITNNTYDLGTTALKSRDIYFGRQLLAPNGSAGTPSWSFENFPTSGVFTSSGSFSVSTSGVLAFSVNTTGNFTFGKTTNATTLTLNAPAASLATYVRNANDGGTVISGGTNSSNGGVLELLGGAFGGGVNNRIRILQDGTEVFSVSQGNVFTIGKSGETGTHVINGALNPSLGIIGVTTNSNAAAGTVGQYIESVVSTATNVPAATGVWGNMTSISLTAGDWDVTGTCQASGNGAAVVNPSLVAISIFSGATTTDHVTGSNVLQLAPPGSTAGSDRSVVVSSYRISLSGTTTVYFKENWTYTVATPQYQCRLSARRIR